MAPPIKHPWHRSRTTFRVPSGTYSDLRSAAKAEAERRHQAVFVSPPNQCRQDRARTVIFYDPPHSCSHCGSPGPRDTGYFVWVCDWCGSLIFPALPPEEICERCFADAGHTDTGGRCPRSLDDDPWRV